jgi:uncharacterized Rmd1/YagE family protein
MKIEAFLVAEQINVRKFKTEFTGKPYSSTNFEIFYVQEHGKFLYLFNYGAVVFANYSDLEKSDLLKFLRSYSEKPVEIEFKEDLLVEINAEQKPVFGYSSVQLPSADENVTRIIMLNIAQSVVMDFYETLGNQILDSTKKFTEDLELYGKIKISQKNLIKFIGKTLNIKNSIFDNLYIFNSHDITWENEYLEQVDKNLKEMFDIKMRFRELDYELKIVEDNLRLFTELSQNRESTRLEWIVILLILMEVIDLVISKLL